MNDANTPRADNPLRLLYNAFSSFGMSVAVLSAMFVLVYFGTLAQVEHGLHKAQGMYFNSWYCVVDGWWGLRFPWPGGLTLMTLLTFNLVIGGIIRLRYSWSRVGNLITHLGIVLLMVAGFIKYTQSFEGALMLHVGDQGSQFESYSSMEIAIIRQSDQGQEEWVIPQAAFSSRGLDNPVTFTHEDLPFDLEVYGFYPNARVQRKGPMFDAPTPVVNKFFVKPVEWQQDAENNFAACYARALLDGNGPAQGPEGILWVGTRAPWSVEIEGKTWGVKLRRQTWHLPWIVRLDKFTHEVHPNTGTPKNFKSDITTLALGDKRELRKARVEMNEPLRSDDFILFQSSWGPSNAGPGDRLYSIFSVVNNPSDQWPTWSWWIILFGLTLHFGMKLTRYIGKERRTA